jgi:hypothetical protein
VLSSLGRKVPVTFVAFKIWIRERPGVKRLFRKCKKGEHLICVREGETGKRGLMGLMFSLIFLKSVFQLSRCLSEHAYTLFLLFGGLG